MWADSRWLPTLGHHRQASGRAPGQRRETVRVYAVLAQSAAEALALVGDLATKDMQVEMVGSLGRDITRRLGL